MYLNIGHDVTIKKSSIVGIFDIDEAESAESLKIFLAQAEKNGKTRVAGYDLPKSFVLLTNGEIWFSPFLTKVLKRRAEKENVLLSL